MRLQSIEIFGMNQIDRRKYDLQRFNYLNGKNGAGKSTVMQAIQLALLGYIPGMGKTNESIMRHANGHTLTVDARIDEEGTEISIVRSWTQTKKGVVSSCDVTPEGFNVSDILGQLELPIFNFGDFLALSTNKQKDWFIKFLPNESAKIDWNKQLTSSLGDVTLKDESLLDELLSRIKSSKLEGVELVRDVNTYLKDVLSFKKQELTRIQATVNSLICYDEFAPSKSYAEMSSEVAMLEDQMRKANNDQSIIQRNETIQVKLSELNLMSESDETKLMNQLKENIESSSKDHENESIRLSRVQTSIVSKTAEIQMESAMLEGEGICPYSKQSCDAIKPLIESTKQKIENLKKDIEGLNIELADLATKSKKSYDCVKQNESRMSEIRSARSNYNMLKSQIVEVIPLQSDAVPFLKEQIDSIRDDMTKLKANEKYNSLIDQLTSEKSAVEQSVEVLKVWIKLTDANGLQTEMMSTPFAVLADNMTNYLQRMFNDSDISADFNLVSKANSFNFGLIRNKTYIPFEVLSSGEKCMYTVALLTCIVSMSDCPIKLIMIDDLLDHLDDINLSQVFEAASRFEDVQFILAGVQPCKFIESYTIHID